MIKSTKQTLLAGLLALSFTGYAADEPAFHTVLKNSPDMASYLYSNQIQQESKVENGVIYTRQHPGAKPENGFAEVLATTMPKFDSRFSQDVNPYWTFQIRLARKNSGSKWHNYAKSLPTGMCDSSLCPATALDPPR